MARSSSLTHAHKCRYRSGRGARSPCDVLVRAEQPAGPDDEPFPGIVEVVFTDAEGTDHVPDRHSALIFDDSLTRDAAYPVVLEIPVEVLQARRTPDAEVSVIRLPWGLADGPGCGSPPLS